MFRDKVYLRTLIRLAAPIVIQEAIFASLNLVDIFMIGQLGETAITTVSLGNQFFFLLAFFLYGVGGGSAVFTAQLWGKRDVQGIHKMMGLGLSLGLIVASLFTIGVIFFPKYAMSIYTNDQAVINAGESYLKIVGYSYIVTAITFCFSMVLRSVENTRLPMIVGVCSLVLKTLLNFLLINGRYGFTPMGIDGAALATSVTRILECIVLIYLTYRLKTPAAARLKDLVKIDKTILNKFIPVAIPVVFNEVLWALGFSAYYAIYARISTQAVAAINISASIESLAFVVFIGICESTAIMVGNRIGAGELDKAYIYARRAIVLGIFGTLLFGMGILAIKDQIISIYNITEASRQSINIILTIFAFTFWVKVSNFNLFVGVFRSGGDTRFAMFLDVSSVWLVGVPLAYLGAFVFKLPVYWVYLMIVAEEFIKFVIAMQRFFSKKWINDVTAAPIELSS